MRKVAIALCSGLMMAVAGGASAAPMTPIPAEKAANGMVQSVADLDIYLGDGPRWRRGYRRCRYWRHECADRWGWRNWRWDRCMARHDC